jgi:glycosyltransferase involved in cell wall biosynthesis
MKVLLTHHYFPPDFAGGGEYVVMKTARGLLERGIDVQVLTTGDPRITEYEGIPTVRLPIHRYAFNLAYSKIRDMARGVDLIQTFNYHACLPSLQAGRQLGKPVVCGILGLCRDAWNNLRTPLFGPVWSAWEKYILTRDFSRVMFFSDSCCDQAAAMGVPAWRSAVNCPGIDLDAYSPAPVKDDVVFFSGRLDGRRGVDNVLATARALPDVQFRMMGWGPSEAKIRKTAPANVEMLKFERGQPLSRAFGKARIFFLPTRAETFGLALVEAMASGCAVISSVDLGFEGVRIRPDDHDGMVQAVRTLWDDRHATARMGHLNVALAQQYNWDRYTERLLTTYSQVLNGA